MKENNYKRPSIGMSISAIVFMAGVVGIGYGVFGMSIQPLLVVAAAYVAFISLRLGYTWADMENAISDRIKDAMPAILIILSVGIVVGSWIFSGTVPMMIYYGLKIINPRFYLPLAFIITAIVSTATGTAWGSTATAGVALIGIATELGIPLNMACGAIIAGGVFGDKISPLSDTTNLAALVCDVDLFDHIKHMLWTTVPASIVGIVVYLIVGRNMGSDAGAGGVEALLNSLDMVYNWNILLVIPIVIIFAGALMKMPTVPIMLLSSVAAIFIGTFSHGFNFVDGVNSTFTGFDVSMIPLVGGFSLNLLVEDIPTLLNRGGIMSMMTIIVTIFAGYSFAAIMEMSGCLDVLLEVISGRVKKPWQLIGITIIGSMILVFSAGVASISILMIGTLLKDAYTNMGMGKKTLSRTLEDSGTMLLPFVPWGASGIFYHEVLGVSPYAYAPWTIACYMCVVFAMFYAVTGIGISKAKPEEVEAMA